MTQIAIILFWVLLGLVAGQTVLVLGYLWVLRRPAPMPLEDHECPQAVAILCVRGADPFLSDCLQGLLSQDYPRYTVHIVVDSRTDPAWEVVQEAIATNAVSHAHLAPLQERLVSCSLKSSGIQQVLESLDESCEVVALLDSDTIPHATWLRELVAPLAEDRIAVSSGNRWYMPSKCSWGSLVRYCWNAAAVVQMYCYGIAWGGSLAFKTSLFGHTDLRKYMRNAFSDDTAICRCIRRYGYHVAYVPSCTMVNREVCTIRGFRGFVQRQLLAARLHHGWWWAVLAHGIITSAVLALGCALGLAALVWGNWHALTWVVAGEALYLASMVLMAIALEATMRRIVRRRDEPVDWLRPHNYLRFVLAILLTQVVYAIELPIAALVRSHRWRGVLYRFGGERIVTMTGETSAVSQPSAEDAASV